jgi:hypothetical protein
MPWRVGQRMEPMQPVRPPANDDQLTKPRSQRGDKAREGYEILQISAFPR